MDQKDFFDRYILTLKNLTETYDLDTQHDALILWYAENVMLADPSEVVERIVRDSYAEGVDAVLIDETNYKLVFVQARAVSDFENTQKNFPENDIKLTLEGVRFLLKEDYRGKITPELQNLVDEYHELDKTGDYETIVLFLTLRKKAIASKFIQSFQKEFQKIKVTFSDFDTLFDFYENVYLLRRAAPPQKVSFKVITDLLKKDVPHKSRVFTSKGEELAKIYNDYRERIFQQNVRYSLGLRSRSINRQILETAVDDKRSPNFWYFNNGITIVCKKINEAASEKVINLIDAQIINGAQTTYALHEAYKKGLLKENVEILIKAIETGDKDFVEKVTLYTNSQNAIRLRDLCSNDKIQLSIQKILLDSYKFFYERKRGEFSSMYPTDGAARQALGKNYKAKIISNENSAQAFLTMYLDKPSQAKSEKGRIFLKDKAGFYDEIFDEKDSNIAEKLLMSWRLLKYIENDKKRYYKDYKKAQSLPPAKKNSIYRCDFLLHSEHFVLNMFKDFLADSGFDINAGKDKLLSIISMIDSNDKLIEQIYSAITACLAEYMTTLKAQPSYYHTKFFKNEKSIGLVRQFFNTKFGFVAVM